MGQTCCMTTNGGKEQILMPTKKLHSDQTLSSIAKKLESTNDLTIAKDYDILEKKEKKRKNKKRNSTVLNPTTINVVKAFNPQEAKFNSHSHGKQSTRYAKAASQELNEPIQISINKDKEESKDDGSNKQLPYPRSTEVKSGKLMMTYSINFRISPETFRCEKKGNVGERYQIISFIDQGTFGVVNMVFDTETNEVKAEKVMKKDSCQMTDNFADEIKILKKLVLNSL